MMNPESIKGKKLLILGATASEISLVKRAQSYGVYTVVADNHTDHALAPAKDVADEYWDISWSDIDALEKKCIETGIDGICAGYSEFRVENQIKLCERLGLPCYCTVEQLDITRDKLKFKKACREAGVPTVTEYSSPDEVDCFPVIVKPVDRGGSIGISVASDRDELKKSYDYAMEMSVCKQVIIEKYITGTKIDVYYQIRDGKITLVTSSDTINAKANGFERVVQSGWLFPSHYHSLIEEKADPALQRLISNMKIKDGYIFISGFYDKGELMFFETGFRLCGGHIYSYCEEMGSINNLDLFIFHALTGSTKDIRPLNDKRELKCVNINFYAKSGTIGEISGFNEVGQIPDCKLALVTGRVGQKCNEDNAILSKMAMCYFCNSDAKKIEEDVKRAYELIKIVGDDGKDMIYDRIDTDAIGGWWK